MSHKAMLGVGGASRGQGGESTGVLELVDSLLEFRLILQLKNKNGDHFFFNG